MSCLNLANIPSTSISPCFAVKSFIIASKSSCTSSTCSVPDKCRILPSSSPLVGLLGSIFSIISITCFTCTGFACGYSPSLKPFNTLILVRVPPIVRFFSSGFQKPAIDFSILCIGLSVSSGLSIVIPHSSHASPRVITLYPKSNLVSNVAPASNALISFAFNPAILAVLSATGAGGAGGAGGADGAPAAASGAGGGAGGAGGGAGGALVCSGSTSFPPSSSSPPPKSINDTALAKSSLLRAMSFNSSSITDLASKSGSTSFILVKNSGSGISSPNVSVMLMPATPPLSSV